MREGAIKNFPERVCKREQEGERKEEGRGRWRGKKVEGGEWRWRSKKREKGGRG